MLRILSRLHNHSILSRPSKAISTMSLPIPPSIPSSVAPSPCPSPVPPSTSTSTSPLPSTSPKSLNILFLHGYTQSGPRFQAKTQALTKFLKKTFGKYNITITTSFPTAPSQLRLSDVPQSFSVNEEELEDSWAWWRRDDASGQYKLLDECWKFLSDYLDTHGPFHFVIGFSQGGALAALLASLLATSPPRPRPESFTTSHPPLLGCVEYCGFRAPNVAGLDDLYIPPITAPVLHVLGSLDTVVSEERSIGLVDACENGRDNLVWHPGGHYVVIQRPYMEKVVAFMMKCIKESAGESGDNGKGGEKEEDVNDMDVPF